MKSHIVFSSLFSLFFSLITATSSSVAASEHSTVTFALDNDGTFGVDQDYSNGIFISYTSSAISTPSMLTYLSLSIWEKPSLDKFEFTLGHKMWTPSDIESTEPVANDRPYAGYFYGEFNFISLSPQQVQRFNLTLGATGESSFADQAQKIVHKMTGSDEPKGWEYQIEDDVVGGIGYLSHVNLSRHALFDNDDSAHTSFNNTEFEISNITEINVGGFRSDVATGMMIRWGTDLAANMGAAGISTEHPFRPGNQAQY